MNGLVAEQIRYELTRMVTYSAIALGGRLYQEWAQVVADRASGLASDLIQADDPRLALDTARNLMMALWPHVEPEELTPSWWRTPLGLAVARVLGPVLDTAEDISISQATAAAMLGLVRGSVAQMVHRGTLDRHPDGGVRRSSVLQRLDREPDMKRPASDETGHPNQGDLTS